MSNSSPFILDIYQSYSSSCTLALLLSTLKLRIWFLFSPLSIAFHLLIFSSTILHIVYIPSLWNGLFKTEKATQVPKTPFKNRMCWKKSTKWFWEITQIVPFIVFNSMLSKRIISSHMWLLKTWDEKWD